MPEDLARSPGTDQRNISWNCLRKICCQLWTWHLIKRSHGFESNFGETIAFVWDWNDCINITRSEIWSILMLLCDLSKSMQLLCRLIMQSSFLTLVVQYGTELAEVPESRTLIFVGSLFFGPVSHNTTPAFGDVRGFPVGRGYWVKMRTRTCSSPQGWKHPWNNRTLRTVYEKSWQNNAKASVLVPDFNKIYLSWIQYEKQIGQPWNPVVISTSEINAQK